MSDTPEIPTDTSASDPAAEATLPKLGEQPEGYRSGFVAVVGMPNAGKSTLVNALVGRESLITSDKPQTTRHQIRCVSTTDKRQLLFVDTPGWLRKRRKLDVAMAREIQAGLDGVDVVLLVVDATRPELGRLGPIRTAAKQAAPNAPLVVAVSKLDLVGKNKAIPILDNAAAALDPDQLIPVSGMTRDNLEGLERLLVTHLPEGPVLYPPEMVVDRSPEFLAAEFIREQIFRETREEVPFATAVEIERYSFEDRRLEVEALIYVDRKSQKAILLGKQGSMIREIKRRSIIRMKKYTGAKKVQLDFFVKVVEGWRDKAGALKDLGIGVDA